MNITPHPPPQGLTLTDASVQVRRRALPSPPAGFTIIELLVVVTVIVILLALMVPGLQQAVEFSYVAKCGSNLRAIGQASALYLNDNKNTYAAVYHWHGLVGKYGVYEPGATGHPYVLNPGQRPLNAYLGYTGSSQAAPGSVPFTGIGAGPSSTPDQGEVPVAECPSDLGDSLRPGVNAYQEFGTSYIVTVVTAHFKIDQVFGNLMNVGAFPSKKSTKLKPQHTKVLVTDWIVYGNRQWNYDRTRWHGNDLNRRVVNTVFADGHAALTEYELELIDDGHGADAGNKRGNPSWHWW